MLVNILEFECSESILSLFVKIFLVNVEKVLNLNIFLIFMGIEVDFIDLFFNDKFIYKINC